LTLSWPARALQTQVRLAGHTVKENDQRVNGSVLEGEIFQQAVTTLTVAYKIVGQADVVDVHIMFS
jgi:hypothetical protein